jgi:CcmD family protein
MSEWTFVNAAYALTWLALGAYAVSLRVRRRRLEQQVRSETGGAS